jgi:hypothetical protein
VLLIDAANVVGSRPTGWWRDRAGAAGALVDRIRGAVGAGRVTPPVVVVLEGKARAGAPEGLLDGVAVLHARASGDEQLVDVVTTASKAAEPTAVTLVTADRALRHRAEALGADVVGPSWLLARLDPPPEGAGDG